MNTEEAGYPKESEDRIVSRVTLTISTFLGFLHRKEVIELENIDSRALVEQFIEEFVKE